MSLEENKSIEKPFTYLKACIKNILFHWLDECSSFTEPRWSCLPNFCCSRWIAPCVCCPFTGTERSRRKPLLGTGKEIILCKIHYLQQSWQYIYFTSEKIHDFIISRHLTCKIIKNKLKGFITKLHAPALVIKRGVAVVL